MGVYAQRLWTIFNYWIKKAFGADEQSETETIKGNNFRYLQL
jgi:hypothetical protein